MTYSASKKDLSLQNDFSRLYRGSVNISRFLKLSPEEAMVHANHKFRSRFSFVETSVKGGRGEFADYTLDELEAFWQLAKGREQQ